MRESPALDVIHLLQDKGAVVRYHDPFVPHFQHEDWAMQSITDAEVMPAVSGADAVVIITNHSAYDYPAILNAAQLIIDTRNALGATGYKNPKVVRL
jgi:UDP-N-acetyl-D-glucosamine dehydrogenase